jgi:hypothetical protein
MIFKKKDINEIIDSNGELIGANATPTTGSDLETQASNTTDYNAKVAAQPFRYDMLGRFGFTMMPFMESSEAESNKIDINFNELVKLIHDVYLETLEYYYRNPNKLKNDFRILSKDDIDNDSDECKAIENVWNEKLTKLIKPFLDNEIKTSEKIDEGNVIEDKVISTKSEDELSKKGEDKELKDKKLEKIAGLINKLDKNDVNKLINLLERNNG